MREEQRFSLVDGLLLLVVVVWAAGTRAAYLSLCADNGRSAGPLQVQDAPPVLTGLPPGTELRGQSPPNELDAMVHNLTEHRWFGSLAPFAAVEEQTAHTAPGYPWLLALLARYGHALGPVDQVMRWIQCGLGTLTALFYFLFARLAFRNQFVAVLAGLLCAVHPFWVINTAALNDGVLATFLLALSVYLGARAGQSGGALACLLLGLTLAGLALVRAALLPFSFAAVLWFLLRSSAIASGWRCALLAFLGFVIGLAPWTLRNYQVFGDALPIVNSTYLHLWMGNNPHATGGPMAEETMFAALADQRGEAAAAPVHELGELKQRARYNALASDVLHEIRANPLGALQRRMWAGLYFFFGEDWFKDQVLWHAASSAEESMPAWLAQCYPGILCGSLFGMLLLGVLGWRWTYGWSRQAMPSSLAVMWIVLPYLLSHAESLSGPRLPLDGILLTYAAFAIACFIPPIGKGLLRDADFPIEPAPKPR